jgi:oligosaccharyltransferase complex subunit epsilon
VVASYQYAYIVFYKYQLMSSKEKTAAKKTSKAETSAELLIPPVPSKKPGEGLFESAVSNFWKKYSKDTPSKIKLIDSFMLFLLSLIVWVMFYRIIVGNDFPKNAFLSSVYTPLGVLAMAVALRMHICGDDGKLLRVNQQYRPFWEFMFGLIVIFVVGINFLG